jgi:hypothetical protein
MIILSPKVRKRFSLIVVDRRASLARRRKFLAHPGKTTLPTGATNGWRVLRQKPP